MIKRTIYINNPAYLHMGLAQLRIKQNDELAGTIPMEDIGVLILDNPQITISHSAIRTLSENKSVIISCDERHMPSSYMLPLEGHSEQMRAHRWQFEAKKSLLSKIWYQIIFKKIENQAKVLRKLRQIPAARRLEHILRAEDQSKLSSQEGYAAAVYWRSVLPGIGRDRYGEPPNNYLNYGYAVLRAMVARAIVGAGLMPTIGVHHRNRNNPYCLADDLMEAFRPFVDLIVLEMMSKQDVYEEILSLESRKNLLRIATVDARFGRHKRPLMVGLEICAASLRKCYSGEKRRLILPDIIIPKQ